MRIKQFLKRPAYAVMLVISYTVDFFRYLRSASVIYLQDSDRKLAALIRKDNHRIEKGLSLPAPRAWFGEPVLARQTTNLSRYLQSKNADSDLLAESAAVLQEYVTTFEAQTQPRPVAISKHLDILNELLGDRPSFAAGTVEINKAAVQNDLRLDFEDFVKSRFSIRQFDGSTVPMTTIAKAVELATKTPSVCNRCAWKVYNVADQVLLKKVLACQNGNAGFGQTCGNVLIVAMDLRCFEGGGERNQAYVDGGLFAMSLVYALHSETVASCFLNWSVDFFQDSILRKLLNIPTHEVIVTFIGIGGYPDKLKVAISPRPHSGQILLNI